MKNNEDVKATGSFRLTVIENGEIKEIIEEKNLVVTLGLQNMARIIGGHADGLKIDKIGVGIGTDTPLPGDTALTSPFIKDLEGATYPDNQSVLFSFDIDNDEANDMLITEFGLLNTNEVLCARKVRTGSIAKTDSIRLVGTWKLTFS